MTQFTTHGPFVVPTIKLAGGRSITKAEICAFWEKNPDYKGCVGCYVFGMRAGKGITPLYVGKATKNFGQEAFAHHKLSKYLPALTSYRRGTPVIFFVVYPPKKGTTNLTHIGALEKFLIQQGVAANPLLLNISHAKVPAWGIAGILRSETKKPSKAAAAFKSLFGFQK